jgi:hypothetical protein
VKSFLLKSLYIIATGTIFYVFSERYFWSFWRTAEDTTGATITGIIFYSLAAYSVLFLIDRYQINSKEGLLIVGLLFGFLIEGMMAGMLYTPLLLLVITVALPWHAFVTLFLGWQYLPRVFGESGWKKKIVVASALAVAWFVWAIGWFVLPTAAINAYTVENFITHGLLTTAVLIALYQLTAWLGSRFVLTFKTYEAFVILGLLFLCLGLVHPATIVYSFPLSALVITGCVLLLRRQKMVANPEPTVYTFTSAKLGLLWLFIIYALTSFLMLVAVGLKVKVMTAYAFACIFTIATVWYGYKSVRYFIGVKRQQNANSSRV